jgi:hypothetical protein
MFWVEDATDRLDRLVFEGHRRIVEDGVSCWCPIGKHWMVYPLPESVGEDWWTDYGNFMIDDHAKCSAKRWPDK